MLAVTTLPTIIPLMQSKDSQNSSFIAYITVGLAILLGGGSMVLLGIFLVSGSFHLLDMGLPIPAALTVDAVLCLAFFMQHSGMVRRSFQRRFDSIAPGYYRAAVYAIASGVILLILLLFWQRTEPVVLSVEGPLRWGFHAALLASLAVFFWSSRSLGEFDALGIQPVLAKTKGIKAHDMPLTIRGAYRWVRHPIYTASLLLIWSQPDLTYDRILFNVTWTGWIIIGSLLEERDLVLHFGSAYTEYQQKVPMLIPWRIPSGD